MCLFYACAWISKMMKPIKVFERIPKLWPKAWWILAHPNPVVRTQVTFFLGRQPHDENLLRLAFRNMTYAKNYEWTKKGGKSNACELKWFWAPPTTVRDVVLFRVFCFLSGEATIAATTCLLVYFLARANVLLFKWEKHKGVSYNTWFSGQIKYLI